MAYWTVISSAYLAPPTACAAARITPSSITWLQVAHPLPALPMRSAAPTRTRSRSTWYCASEPIVNCWVRRTASSAGSTRKRSIESSESPVRARTTSRVAALAKETWRFTPERTKPSPSGTARTCTPRGEKPWSGSSHAGVSTASPLDDRREPLAAELFGACSGERSSAEDRAHEVGRGCERAAELLVEDDAFEGTHPRTAVLLRKEEADQVEVGELLPQLRRIADRVVLEFPDDAQRASSSRRPRVPSRGASPARE